jgi:hypothetical protein
MRFKHYDPSRLFERGVVVLSLDTEQMWGYFDLFSELQFRSRYPDALEAHQRLLACLCAAGLSATWFVVGGMALRESDGARDLRMTGLPADWTAKIPAGQERTTPLWYRRSFVDRLREAQPFQEVGLHAGLTHFIWTDGRATQDVVRRELREGVRALEQASVRPLCFSFGREQEAYHELLRGHGIRAYRGGAPVLACRLGRTLPGALLRALNEMTGATPPTVWPQETLPGLWNIPSSLFLYPIGPSRARFVALRSRVQRFSRGVEAAARHRGIFHFSLHPENLAESRHGFSLFGEILEHLTRSRDRGDVEILTMGQLVARIERAREMPVPGAGVDLPSDSLAGVATKSPHGRFEKHSKGIQTCASQQQPPYS